MRQSKLKVRVKQFQLVDNDPQRIWGRFLNQSTVSQLRLILIRIIWIFDSFVCI